MNLYYELDIRIKIGMKIEIHLTYSLKNCFEMYLTLKLQLACLLRMTCSFAHLINMQNFKRRFIHKVFLFLWKEFFD